MWGECDPNYVGNPGKNKIDVNNLPYGIDELTLINPELIKVTLTPPTEQIIEEYSFKLSTNSIADIMPELVKTSDSYQGINQIGLISVIINAIKQQNLKIEELTIILQELKKNNLVNSGELDHANSRVFTLYPNPFDTELTIEFQESVSRIVITDLTGKFYEEIDLNNERNGIYILKQADLNLIQGIYLFNALNKAGRIIGSEKVAVK